jgi:glycosyltransferase involved in cell wall biosynthesis
MFKALQKHCGNVFQLGPVKSISLIGKCINKASKISLKKQYNYEHSIILAKRYGKIFSSKISRKFFNLIFAPAASTEIAFLDVKIPTIYLSDTTFALMNNYYPGYTNLLDISVREGNLIEGLAIKKASLLLYPSEWAAESAIKDYQADKSKIHVIPFGANFDYIPPKEIILEKKKSPGCRLLFLAVEWQRKGGDIAFETLLKLEDLGIQAELIVCGCKPSGKIYHNRMTYMPFLDKNDERQQKELYKLYLSSDFLLLPTRAECLGNVFCEASAFGLPVISTDTGGVGGVVRNGENGYLLPISATGSDYAKVIYDIYRDDSRYYEMVKSSRKAFEERLNWDAWGIEVRKIINKIL